MNRLLVDECLSWRVARDLRQAGLDAVHVHERGLGGADDSKVVAEAAGDGRVLVTRDADFTNRPELARHRVSQVQVVQQGPAALHRPGEQVAELRRVLPQVEAELDAGAVVSVERDRFAVNRLAPPAHQQVQPSKSSTQPARGQAEAAAVQADTSGARQPTPGNEPSRGGTQVPSQKQRPPPAKPTAQRSETHVEPPESGDDQEWGR